MRWYIRSRIRKDKNAQWHAMLRVPHHFTDDRRAIRVAEMLAFEYGQSLEIEVLEIYTSGQTHCIWNSIEARG